MRLGEWNISSAFDCQDGVCSDPPVDIAIQDTFTRYDSDFHDVNNLAVIKLAEEAQYSSNDSYPYDHTKKNIEILKKITF